MLAISLFRSDLPPPSIPDKLFGVLFGLLVIFLVWWAAKARWRWRARNCNAIGTRHDSHVWLTQEEEPDVGASVLRLDLLRLNKRIGERS